MLKFISNWFKPKYPAQVLSDKQRELLDLLDNKLVELHANKIFDPGNAKMSIKSVSVPFMYTCYSPESIMAKFLPEIGEFYIPRGIALIVSPNGDWVFAYAVRDKTGSDLVTTDLFLDCLTRTNSARSVVI